MMLESELESLVALVEAWMLVSIRILCCFLSFPLLSFRAHPIRMRVGLALLLGFIVAPTLPPLGTDGNTLIATYIIAGIELSIGYFAGWIVRVCFVSFDILAEVIGVQTGLSYAASVNLDPSLSSGVLGEFLALLAIAVAFSLNFHIVFLEILIGSFNVAPLGVWPATWDWSIMLDVLAKAFSFGVVLSLPVILVYLIFNICQAILVRVSPQLNLFAVGFAISVPIAFFVLSLIVPYIGESMQRVLAPSSEVLNNLEGMP